MRFVVNIPPLVISLILALHTHGQQLNFEELSQKVPLPASETYNILQDKKGYIWFATEAGYCRYARNSLTVFGAEAGLPEKAVYAATVAPDGVVWVATRDRRILYFKNERFVEAPFSKKYVRETSRNWGFPVRLHFDDHHLYILDINWLRKVELKTHRITTLNVEKFSEVIDIHGVPFFLGQNADLRRSQRVYFDKKSFYQDLEPQEFTSFPVMASAGNKIFLGGTFNIYCADVIAKRTVRIPVSDRILSMYIDLCNNLWIGLANKGILIYPNSDLRTNPVRSLENLSVSHITQDSNGGVWCTTLERGVFYCQNPHTRNYNNAIDLAGRLSVLKSTSKSKVYACHSGNETLWELSSGQVKVVGNLGEHSQYVDLFETSRGLWICSSLNSILVKRDGTTMPILMPGDNSFCYGVAENEKLTYIFKYDLIESFDFNRHYRIHTKFRRGRTRSILQYAPNKVLVYGKDLLGVFDLENQNYSPLRPPASDITSAIILNDQQLLLGTKSMGLYIMDITTGLCLAIPGGLPTSTIHTLHKDGPNIWVGTNAGVFKGTASLNSFVNFSLKYNLPRTETRQITNCREFAFFGTNDGLYSVELPLYEDRSQIASPILAVGLDGQNATITFDCVYYETGSESYYYMHGPENIKAQRITGGREILSNLSPGDYQIFGYVRSAADGRRSRVTAVSFRVAPTFFQTWYFWSLVGLSISGLIYMGVRRRIAYIRRKEAEKTRLNTQLAEYQMSALQAQMNPHFIFNAINTIQSYILTQNKDEAYRYLTKFSHLIRMVLHNSQEKVIALKEELEVIQTYLDLEFARFQNFSYSLEVDPAIDPHDIQLPAMIVQPYLENAIWHGLNNLTNRPGELRLRFLLRKEEILVIEIEDNGIGRFAASGHARHGHKSVGLSLTQQRLEMLENIYSQAECKVEIFDLTTSDGQAAGTLVRLTLPVL